MTHRPSSLSSPTVSLKGALHEASMKDIALVKLERKKRAAEQAQREGTVHPYNGLVSTMLLKGAELLQAVIDEPTEGRKFAGVFPIQDCGLPAQVMTAIAARSVVDGISAGHRLQTIAERIGARIEDEIRMRLFEAREPRLYEWMTERFKERGSEDYRHKRRVMLAAIRRANSEETRPVWDTRTKASVGLLLLDCFQRAGMIERRDDVGAKGRRTILVVLSAGVEEALQRREEAGREMLQPWFKPTLDVPLDWTDPEEGGYHTLDLPIMKTRRRQDIERLRAADLSVVYGAINALQRTPWCIHDEVFETAEILREMQVSCEGLPSVYEAEAPRRPDLPPIGTALSPEQVELLREYKAARRFWYSQEATRRSKSTQSLQILEIARELRDEPAFYFPHQLDYRGRAYAVPLQLNPQGNDLSKGLLWFAEGRPLGEMGGFWLAVHGANTWGTDKGALSGRVDWTLENSDWIVRCGEDPIANREWMEADGGKKPWQFLAFCFEWARFIASGEDPEFISHLPVSLDGSCNGLQHFSAMLRDPVGARATNLTADEEQHDIYSEVAAVATRRIKAALEDSATDREIGGMWLNFGVTRKVVKRPVMTTPYGATQIGMKDMVLDDVIKPDKTGFDFGPKSWVSAAWLSEHIYGAIGETVSAAQNAMSFLQGAASALAKEEKPIAWTTPAGLPVVQHIQATSSFRLDTALLGRVQLSFATVLPKLDRRRQKTSIAPNFVHSYDAAHLMLTVCATERELGRPVSWAMVHDSFGTHAGDVQAMSVILRQEFVRMYEGRSPLEELADSVRASLRDHTKCPPAPRIGNFDVREVLKAEFFFA